MSFEVGFNYGEGALRGEVALEAARWQEGSAWRKGCLSVKGARELELWATHSHATERFIYLRSEALSSAQAQLFARFGLRVEAGQQVTLPGQLLLGAERARVVAAGVEDCFRGPAFREIWQRFNAEEIALFPVLREGMKYGMAEGALAVGHALCDEIVVDGHHVADPSVPGLGRRMELSAFKDADLTNEDREQVKVAVLGDSVASGTVIVGLVAELARRFPNLERVELIAPLAAVYGLARIAAYAAPEIPVRIHCFETLVNALAPDYYFSPHYEDLAMHILPEVEERYREWWGKDGNDRWIADSACSGYGWSEAFFNPIKQLRMIEAELQSRHGLGLQTLFSRHAGM